MLSHVSQMLDTTYSTPCEDQSEDFVRKAHYRRGTIPQIANVWKDFREQVIYDRQLLRTIAK